MNRKALFQITCIGILIILVCLFFSDPKTVSDRLINTMVLGVTAFMFLWTLYYYFCIDVSSISVTLGPGGIPNSADWYQITITITNKGQKTAAVKRVVLATDKGELHAHPCNERTNQLVHGDPVRYEFDVRNPVKINITGLFVEDYNNQTWYMNEEDLNKLSAQVYAVIKSRGWK